jgi:hypothetical protein
MIVKNIDIRDVLKTQFATILKREKAEKYIKENCLIEETKYLYIFDLTNCQPDHYFCQSFKDVYAMSFSDTNNSDLLFKVHDYQVDELLKGILDSNSIEYSNENFKTVFPSHGLSIKLWFAGEEKIRYISSLDDDSYKVINYVTEKGETKSQEILKDGIVDPLEKLGDILKNLVKKRFLYNIEGNAYTSVNSLINLNYEYPRS